MWVGQPIEKHIDVYWRWCTTVKGDSGKNVVDVLNVVECCVLFRQQVSFHSFRICIKGHVI